MNARRQWLLAGVLLAGLPAGRALGDVPQKINDEGRLYDASSNAPVTGSHTLKFAIYSAAQGGTPLWQQTSAVMFDDGFFETTLDGSATAATPFPADLFDGTELFLGVTVDSDAEMSPREPMDSVPYALMAGGLSPGGDIQLGSVASRGSANGTGRGVGNVYLNGTAGGLQVFFKTGDNGTANCAAFCETSTLGPLGACIGAKDAVTGAYVDCNTLGNPDSLSCYCIAGP
jgi:hypothetical protein